MFLQGLLLKAESYYQMGQFEFALMFYHRGHKLRPEVEDFRKGIQKAQEAIDNSIGSKFNNVLILSWGISKVFVIEKSPVLYKVNCV